MATDINHGHATLKAQFQILQAIDWPPIIAFALMVSACGWITWEFLLAVQGHRSLLLASISGAIVVTGCATALIYSQCFLGSGEVPGAGNHSDRTQATNR